MKKHNYKPITAKDLGLTKEQQEAFAHGARIVFGNPETEGLPRLTEPTQSEDIKE